MTTTRCQRWSRYKQIIYVLHSFSFLSLCKCNTDYEVKEIIFIIPFILTIGCQFKASCWTEIIKPCF